MASKSELSDALYTLKSDLIFVESVEKIRAGTFIRDETDEGYYARIVYAKALRNFVYNSPALNQIFFDDTLKELFFRTFGYKGPLSFTMYPAVWIRDLPLLNFGHKAYFGDGILLGSNQLSPDQKTIKVGPIDVGEYSIFDQQCAIGLNTTIGNHCQFGFRNSIGLRCTIGNRVRVREMSSIGNCVKIGDDTFIGQNCTIHDFCVIEAGTKIDDGTRIPRFSVVSNEGIRLRRGSEQALADVKSLQH